MPGETMDLGTVKARHVQDYDFDARHPGYKTVLVSKSDKASPGMTMAEAYKSDGWVFLEESPHPDLAVYGITWDEFHEREREQAVLGKVTGGITATPTTPVSRQELHGYGTPVTTVSSEE